MKKQTDITSTHLPFVRIAQRFRVLLALAILAPLLAVFGSSNPAEAQTANDQPVLLVHGFAQFANIDCEDYFEPLKAYLEDQGREVFTVGYYKRDRNCDVRVPGSYNNTSLTSIDNIGFELSLLLDGRFAGRTVDIVAHSMGGLIVRDMLDDDGRRLRVDDVVTVGTPHDGALASTLGLLTPGYSCAVITQCRETLSNSWFLRTLEHNPQSSIRTTWTLIGSHHDEVVGADTGIAMGRGDIRRPAVGRLEYGPVTRTGSCGRFNTVNHQYLAGTGEVGLCLPDRFGPVYRPMESPAERVVRAIR